MSTTTTTTNLNLNLAPGTDAGTHVVGAPLTTGLAAQASPSLDTASIDTRITRIRPSSTPIDQISRMAEARICSAMKVEYYIVDTKPIESRLAKAWETTDVFEIAPGYKVMKVKVMEPSIYDESETVLFSGIKTPSGSDLMGYIYGKTDDGELRIMPVNGMPTSDISVGTFIIRMGRAATELDVQTPQFQALPAKNSNNCQIFKMQIEQSTLQKLTSKEVNWTLSDQEEAAVIDMRLGMEKSFLFGVKAELSHPRKQDKIYCTEGIWNQATQHHEINVKNLTHNNLIDICSVAFTDNCGSKKRIMLAGKNFITAISKLPVSHNLDVRNPHAKWGIVSREIVTNFGHLYLVHSEVFDQCGHSYDAFIIDPAHITKYVHIPFHAENLDLRASGQRNTDAVVLTEASCLVLRYPKSHLRIIHKE